MANMKIKKGDTVVVLSGKDKGKQGKVQAVIPADRKVVVEGVNIVTCHTKPRRQGETGGIVKSAARAPALLIRLRTARRSASASIAAQHCKGGFDTWLD